MKLKRGKDPLALLACGAIKIDTAADLRPWLNAARVGRGLTIAELAKLVGAKSSTVAMWLLDSRPDRCFPSTRQIAKLSQALGLAVVLVPVDNMGKTDPRVIPRPESIRKRFPTLPQ